MEADGRKETTIRRREAVALLIGIGSAVLAYFTAGPRAIARALAAEPGGSAAATCVLSRETTEGPYWVENRLTRRDITEGRKGAGLGLSIKVIDVPGCKPIKGADVELWHADARGAYSGVSGASSRFLRGHQKTNAAGVVRFETLYPGWYPGRTPHIHVKVHVGGSEVHTGQIFFTDAASRSVYRTGVYSSRGQADTTNGSDSIYRQTGGSRATARVSRRRGGGYRGTVTLGVRA